MLRKRPSKHRLKHKPTSWTCPRRSNSVLNSTLSARLLRHLLASTLQRFWSSRSGMMDIHQSLSHSSSSWIILGRVSCKSKRVTALANIQLSLPAQRWSHRSTWSWSRRPLVPQRRTCPRKSHKMTQLSSLVLGAPKSKSSRVDKAPTLNRQDSLS